MNEWIKTLYADIDGMRLSEVVGAFADDGEVVFGNNPPAVGHAAIEAALSGFWAAIGSMRHEWRNVWEHGDTAVLEAAVHYTTHGSVEVAVPSVTVIDRDDSGHVWSLRVHIDLAPLFTTIAAEDVVTS
jgi:hypothetical protein